MRPSQSRLYLLVSRLLLSLIAVVLAVTPLSEHLLDFDHFLRGGQDFELGLLALLATCCLVLVLAHLCREALQRVVALILSVRWPHSPPYLRHQRGGSVIHSGFGPGSPAICFQAPLRI